MVFKVYSLYDGKAECFMPPFFQVNVALAKRIVIRLATDGVSDLHHYVSDYALFEIGEWLPESGVLVPYEAKKDLGLVSSFIPKENI